MSSSFSIDGGILLGGVLLLVGVVGSGLASRFRVPNLLLFLALGMAVADDGLGIVHFSNTTLAQNIAIAALAIILFEGGLGTDSRAFKEVGVSAGLLATVGVLITAAVVALPAWWILGLEPATALLVGAVVSSTDAAAVFTALRSDPLPLRTQQLLQLESGMNDPVAVLLTIGMVEVWRGDPTATDWIIFLTLQIGAGIIVGIGVGQLGRWLVDHASGAAAASLGMVTLAIGAMSYGLAATVGGSGLLAVYLTGVVLTGSQRASRSVLYFHEGLAATAQGFLFLLLGMLVFPTRLGNDIGVAIVVAATLVWIARPLAVALVLSLTKTSPSEMALVSWAGLRGAAPVVLATIPFTAGHPDGQVIFDVAFAVVVLSVAVQAPTVGMVARKLGLVLDDRVLVRREIVPVDALDADLVEITIPAAEDWEPITLRAAPPPNGARVALIHRLGTTVIPNGDTTIEGDDVLLIITPRTCDLDKLESWIARDELPK